MASDNTISLSNRVVLVTGANGGLGEQFVMQALEAGASKVYAAARKPRTWQDTRVEALALDITDPTAITRAAATASNVDLLVNNAAIAPVDDLISGPEEAARQIFDTNFFGTLAMANAFAPVLRENGGGTLLNIISAAAWVGIPTVYAASKAALWSATNALRFQLEAQGTQVVGLLVGMVDTPMTATYDVPKISAASVVAQAYAGVAAGALEVLADDMTQDLKARLATPGETLYPWVHDQLRLLLS